MLDKICRILWKIASCTVAVAVILFAVGIISKSDVADMIASLKTDTNEAKAEDEDVTSPVELTYYKSKNDTSEDYSEYQQPDDYANVQVWVTRSGECFHLDRDCFHIKNKDVASSTVSESFNNGKRPCEDCSYEVITYYD